MFKGRLGLGPLAARCIVPAAQWAADPDTGIDALLAGRPPKPEPSQKPLPKDKPRKKRIKIKKERPERRQRPERENLPAGMGWCSYCEQVLPADAFYRDLHNPSGLQGWCKCCKKKHAAEYRKKKLTQA